MNTNPNPLNPEQTKRISKFLSLVLRHDPAKIGLELDPSGWTSVDTLLKKMSASGPKITREMLEHVVATNDKKRFAFSEDGTMIRASQGHSVEVNLGYEAVEPPEFLFHGTVPKFVASIKENGLKAMSRHDVHLSKDRETAVNVGNRRGNALILTVRAGAMHRAGYPFYVSENGVWLTKEVPAEFIEFRN
ncbi:MAG: RNA 2'-phosphotransferase [Bacteroidia bacterium]|nr:RNA 2'-phosphotransferase [Bacteroidia bacterium]